MPAAVAGAVAALGTALGGAAGAALIMGAEAIASTVLALGAIGGNAALSAQAKRKAERARRDSYNASLRDREVMIRSAIAPRRIVLGRDRISGPIIYAQSTGNKGQYLHLVIALAQGPCEAIDEVWFNEIKLPDPDGSGDITSGEFARAKKTARTATVTTGGTTLTLPHTASLVTAVSRGVSYTNSDGEWIEDLVTGWAHTPPSASITGVSPGTYTVNYETTDGKPRVRIKKYLGGAGQVADPDLVAASGGKWTSDHVGHGICYLYVRLEYDQDIWGQIGVPNITAVVRGGRVFDPRGGGSYAWSDNAALLAAYWLRDSTFGFGADSLHVPAAELSAEANICDELVTLNVGGDTQKRYTFNGSFTSDESPRDVLEEILACMAGSAVWVQGRWLLRAGAYRTPVLTITADHLAGPGVAIVPKAQRTDLFNAVRVTHRDAAQDWTEVQAPLVANAGYQTDDGGRQMVREVTLASEMDTLRAQRLAKVALERARQALTVHVTTSLRGYDLAPTDTVYLTLARYGFEAKVFEVLSRTYDPLGTLKYTLRETAAGVFAWNYGEATVGDLAPDTTLPSPYTIPAALTGLAVDAGPSLIQRGRNGMLTPRALVVWDASTEVFVVEGGRIDVQWKTTAATEWQDAPPVLGNQTQTILAPMPDGAAVLVRVRAVNAAGRASDWTTKAENVVRTALYATASLIDATWWRPGAAWEWALNEDTGGENSIVWGAGPHGESQALWRAVQAGTPSTGRDGGWNDDTLAATPKNAFVVDVTKTYRFSVPVRRVSGTGPLYLGPSQGGAVCDLNTSTPNSNPYFVAGDVPLANRWYLFVGYVYPAGSAGLTNAGAGIFDMDTGQLIGAGTNFCWASGTTQCSSRAYQFYASAGAEAIWAPPQVEIMDGATTARPTYIGAEQISHANLSADVASDLASALSTAAAAQATADGKIDSYWQTSPPGSASEGDIWFDTDDGLKQYRYTSGSWVVAADMRIGSAISAAATAQATADGKVVTFIQASAPTAEGVGDLWIDTDDGNMVHRWNGASWVAIPVGTGAIALGAATTVYSDKLDSDSWSTSIPGVQNDTTLSRSYTNDTGEPVHVEVTYSTERRLTVNGGHTGAVSCFGYLSVVLNGSTLVGPINSGLYDAQGVTAGQTARWRESSVWTYALSAGDTLDISVIVQRSQTGTGSITVDSYNTHLRTTIVKR